MNNKIKAKQQRKNPKTALANLITSVNTINTVSEPEIITADQESKHNRAGKNNIPELFNEEIIKVDPARITNWIYHDRPETELGDIDALAEEFKSIGQQQPCIVRKCKNHKEYDYEIIAGERRWRAALKAGVKLAVVVKNYDDQNAALCQVSENSNRKDISDYAKFKSFSALIADEVLSKDQLISKLNKSQSYIRNLFSYERISDELIEAIGDLSNVTSKTAYEIARLEKKGREFTDILIRIAPKIAEGIGNQHLNKLVNSKLSTSNKHKPSLVLSDSGMHYFTWRTDSNGKRSISFPKNMRDKLDFDTIEKTLKETITQQLMKNKDEIM